MLWINRAFSWPRWITLKGVHWAINLTYHVLSCARRHLISNYSYVSFSPSYRGRESLYNYLWVTPQALTWGRWRPGTAQLSCWAAGHWTLEGHSLKTSTGYPLSCSLFPGTLRGPAPWPLQTSASVSSTQRAHQALSPPHRSVPSNLFRWQAV